MAHSSKSVDTDVQQRVVTSEMPRMDITTPSYATEINIKSSGVYETAMHGIGKIIGTLGAIPGCVLCPNPFRPIPQGFVGLVTRFGKFYKSVDPGLVNINPCTEKITKIDMKIQIDGVDKIGIMTKDNVNVFLDSVLYWHIIDPYLATYGVSDVREALIERTQTTLRGVLGQRVLQDCIENRESIANDIQEMIEQPARAWGVQIESILIKDLQFSQELQESLSSAATQKRIGESKVIAAQAEVDAAKLMREAAEILNTPAAMQIRHLDTMQQMSKNSGTKVIFVPVSQPSAVGESQATFSRAIMDPSVTQTALQNQLTEI